MFDINASVVAEIVVCFPVSGGVRQKLCMISTDFQP